MVDLADTDTAAALGRTDQTWKTVSAVGHATWDWHKARLDLEQAEADYEAAKAAHPERDWRTTASGGPLMRKAIRDMKQAIQDKNCALIVEVMQALNEFESKN